MLWEQDPYSAAAQTILTWLSEHTSIALPSIHMGQRLLKVELWGIPTLRWVSPLGTIEAHNTGPKINKKAVVMLI